MSSPTPKVSNYMSDKRTMSYGSPMARQPSWDSVHALTDSMSKMSVRNQTSTTAPASNQPNPSQPTQANHRRGSASDSSTSSAPVVTPVPSRDADPAYAGTPQPAHVPPGYQYRGPNAPVTLGKPDEVLQVDYNLQPRHFIPGAIGSPQPPAATTGPANGARVNATPNGAAAPFVPSAFSGNNGFYGQPPAGYPAQGGAADNKAAQDIAAQIALTALQGLNAPMQAQPGQPNAAAINPALAAAAAAAAYSNPNLIPGLYGNPLYGAAGVNGAAVPGAQGFYPGQENMAAAVANAVAQLPPGAFQAALQNVGLAAYPLNGIPGAVPGMTVGMPGMMGVGPGAAGMMAAGAQQGGPSANNRKLGLYKTELCRSWEEKGSCRYGPKCQFAHGEEELKRVQRHPKYKTEICRTFWLSGSCPYGKRCCFIHTELPAGEGAEKKDGQEGPRDTTREREEALQRERERERAQIANNDSEQQQTSMLARIRRDPANASAKTPSPPILHQSQGVHPVNGHGTIGGPATVNMTPGSGRPTLGSLRVDTQSINDTTVPKNSYPYTSNPAMPAPGLSLATEGVRGRLSPVPATAGPDFGRSAAARMEVVGVSPQSGSQTPQPGGRPGGHLRSVSQTFPSSIASAIEPNGGRASPSGNVHVRADSWGANTLIAPASAVEPSSRYGERKW